MKTVEQLIFEKRFKDAEFDPNDYNDWAKENEYEAYTLCLAVAKQLQQHLVMQAEVSDGAKEAAVASEGQGETDMSGVELQPDEVCSCPISSPTYPGSNQCIDCNKMRL